MSNDRLKQFNLQQYRFEVDFLPYGQDPIKVTPDSVIQIVLEEQLLFAPTKGFLIIQNPNEMFQRKFYQGKLANTKLLAKKKRDIERINKGYIFRNDGKDKIQIRIKPTKQEQEKNSNIKDVKSLDDTWLIDFVGNIYDVEEPMVSDIGSKIKKLYFWNEEWQKIVERNCYSKNSDGGYDIWSTSTSKLNPNYGLIDSAQATDEQREMFTGDAIRDILENTLGFEIDEDNFDKGKSKIFHTAPAGTNCLDNIRYLWKNHLSEKLLPSGNFDLSIILQDDITKKYQFLPLSTLFEKAGNIVEEPGEYQIEHLLIEDIGEFKKTPTPNWMAPILEKYDEKFKKDVKIHKLNKYSFTEMAGVDSMRALVTQSVFVYDRKNKTFSKNTKDTQINDLPRYLQEDYIKQKFLIKQQLTESIENTHISLNKIKNENIKTNYKFTPIPSGDIVSRLGHGNLMLESILYNLCLTVELVGSTNRKVGRFMGVDRLTNNQNEFDYQIGGQWLTTRISHNFFRNTYVNEITLIKHLVYDKIKFNKSEDIE